MTRVLHVSKTASGGRFIGFQVRHLVREGIDVHLALPGDGPLATMASDAGAIVHRLPSLGETLTKASTELAKTLTATKPDIIHTHFLHSTLAARRARSIAGKHEPLYFQVPGPLHLEQRWSRTLDIKTARPNDHWGPACYWSFDRYLRSGVSGDRVHLSYYGKDLDDYQPDRSNPKADRGALGIPPDSYIVAMVSHVYPPRRGHRRGVKGHEDFIRAIAIARQRFPKIHGIIVGGPRPGAERYYQRLQQLSASVNERGSLTFLGPRSDVPSIYGAADLAVHPSLSENLGGAGESLLMAVPTITTNVGGFPDIIRPDITGVMVPVRRPEQLAAAIFEAARRPRRMQEMAYTGRDLVKQVGNAEANARRVTEVYQRMVPSK